jgi:hypothetical protein
MSDVAEPMEWAAAVGGPYDRLYLLYPSGKLAFFAVYQRLVLHNGFTFYDLSLEPKIIKVYPIPSCKLGDAQQAISV